MYKYSEIKNEQLEEALVLVEDVFLQFEAPSYCEEGIAEFMRFIAIDNIRLKLTSEEMRILICCENDDIVAVLAATANHINLLFVKASHQRKGIGRKLIEVFSSYITATTITVNSAPYALAAYQKIGFKALKEEQTINGIRFIPMSRKLKN